MGCVQCHCDLWDEARLAGEEQREVTPGEVGIQIERQLNSGLSMADQSRTHATCHDGQSTHEVKPIIGDELDLPLRLATPEVCCYGASISFLIRNSGRL